MLNNKRGKDSRQAGMTEGGLTLIEMMIALVVLLLVSLAMMQTALVSIDANMTNALRDEAVGIAEMSMSEARNTPFDTLAAPSGTVTRNIRNITNFQYSLSGTVTSAGTDAKQVDISVTWTWKGQTYTHTISTIVRRQ